MSPTQSPTYTPSISPSIYPASPSNTPSIIPTFLPTNWPTLSPSNTSYPTKSPTAVPSIIPNILSTNTPTSKLNNLHIICHYNDNKDYIIQLLTLLDYAKIMGNVILSSLQSISLQPVNYEQSINNGLTEWKRA
eukprot:133570_1